jgi:hypothetical protein
MKKSDIKKFYDEFSEYYHLIYPNWDNSITRQSKQIKTIINSNFENIRSIHDVSAGIGTQLIGLTSLGYKLSGSDISKKEIERLKVELSNRKLNANVFVCDMMEIDKYLPMKIDLLISCDNSITHLTSDKDIITALKSFKKTVNKGILLTIRDYDDIDKSKMNKTIYDPVIVGEDLITFYQIWRFKGDIYDLMFYMVKDNQEDRTIKVTRWDSKYYAIKLDSLKKLVETAGFTDVKIIKDCFYQPVIVGKVT